MDYSREIADGGSTYYISVPGADGQVHDTAVFIPNSFHQDPTISLILYFHGHHTAYADLRSYINRANTRPLRAAAGTDGRFALIMPWLGKNSDASHIVAGAASFDSYLDAVVAEITTRTAGPSAMSPGFRLVVSAHSGGGVAMTTTISMGGSRYTGRIISAWALDCFYSPGIITTASADVSTPWINWARSNPRASMYLYYTGGTPALNSNTIMAAGLANVHGEQSRVGHDETPKEYFPTLLGNV